ncbi:MAG: hypothetical protein LUH47_06715 [Clostridiales bacterium]|nr:hypothetical protein [Clostridiales bacterium]
MINVQEDPLMNLTFPSDDFDHFKFIQWLECEMSESNKYIVNPDRIEADKIFTDHIKALNLSDTEDMELDSEYGACIATQSIESFVNGYLTAWAILQGKVL